MRWIRDCERHPVKHWSCALWKCDDGVHGYKYSPRVRWDSTHDTQALILTYYGASMELNLVGKKALLCHFVFPSLSSADTCFLSVRLSHLCSHFPLSPSGLIGDWWSGSLCNKPRCIYVAASKRKSAVFSVWNWWRINSSSTRIIAVCWFSSLLKVFIWYFTHKSNKTGFW